MMTKTNLGYVVSAALIGGVRGCQNEALIFLNEALNDLPVQEENVAAQRHIKLLPICVFISL